MAETQPDPRLEIAHVLFMDIVGFSKYHAGRNEEGRVQLEKTFELDPNFWIAHLTLGKVYTQQRKYPEAMAEFAKARELSRGNSEAIGSIGYVSGLMGDKEKARAVLDELKTSSDQRYIPPVNIALVHNGLGDQNEALSQLEKACDDRDVRLPLLKVDPRWDSFRSNPRFVAILKRIGLQ